MPPILIKINSEVSIKPRIWLIVFGIALADRFLNLAALPINPETLLREDALLYWNVAASFIEHGSFSTKIDGTLVPHTERVPGYMLFLAAIRLVFGDSFVAILMVQALVDSVTCLLTAWMAAQLAPRLTQSTGLLAALWPNLVVHSSVILSDSLFLMLFTAMLATACRFLQTGLARWAAAAGLILGLAILIRPIAQILPLLMAPAAFIVPLRYGRAARAATIALLLFLACAIAPLSPLLLRNYQNFASITLTSQTGTHLIGWVAPMVRRAADGTPRDIGASALMAEANARLAAQGIDPKTLDPFKRSRSYAQVGLEALGDYPITAIGKAWATGAIFNLAAPAISIDARVRALPHPSFDETKGNGIIDRVANFLSRSSNAYTTIIGLGIVLSVIGLALQGYGLIVFWRMASWPAALATLCIGYYLVVNGPVGSPKYRLPFEPILIVLTALALHDIAGRLSTYKR